MNVRFRANQRESHIKRSRRPVPLHQTPRWCTKNILLPLSTRYAKKHSIVKIIFRYNNSLRVSWHCLTNGMCMHFFKLILWWWFCISLCIPGLTFLGVGYSIFVINQPGYHESVESPAPSSASTLVPHLSYLISSLKVRH